MVSMCHVETLNGPNRSSVSIKHEEDYWLDDSMENSVDFQPL